ncbi:hypothetical protein [Paraburkholderia sp. MM6662-R1]|uniref:hypothetical protein n=1 Tax=Paraburkholderia sp. MM6662-R1 TaxID=2991066 RepID=UPI003D1BBE49
MGPSLSSPPKKRGRFWLVIFVISAAICAFSWVESHSNRPTTAPRNAPRIEEFHRFPHGVPPPAPAPSPLPPQSGFGGMSPTTVVSFLAALVSLIGSVLSWRRESLEREKLRLENEKLRRERAATEAFGRTRKR